MGIPPSGRSLGAGLALGARAGPARTPARRGASVTHVLEPAFEAPCGSSARDVAAVDVELQPGDERRVVACEVRDCSRDRVRLAQASIGVIAVIESQTPVPFAWSRIGVRMKPGWTEFRRTPSVAQCSVAFLVSVRTEPLAACSPSAAGSTSS